MSWLTLKELRKESFMELSKQELDEIDNDLFVENPREDYIGCCLGTMVYCSTRYKLGDEQMSVQEMNILERSDKIIVLPVYAYIHGMIQLSTKEIINSHSPFDTGKCGFIYVTKSKARSWLGLKRLHKAAIKRIESDLANEVTTYSNYLLSGY